MKKTFTLLVIFLLASSGSAFAAWTTADGENPATSITCGSAGNSVTVPLSPRVEAFYNGNDIAYVIGSRNVQGTRSFATSHDFTGIYYTEGITDAAAVFPALPTTTGASTEWASGTTWKTL